MTGDITTKALAAGSAAPRRTLGRVGLLTCLLGAGLFLWTGEVPTAVAQSAVVQSTVVQSTGTQSVASPDAAERGATDREYVALERLLNPPLGLPQVALPAGNPPTVEKIRLGRKLFFDARLSVDGNMSCATCHLPDQGFTVNSNARAIGRGGQELRRNAPTVMNVAYLDAVLLDGRRTSLEAQALDPFVAPREMANPSLEGVLQTLRGAADYRGLFEEAFGGPATPERVAMAITTYERTLLAADSPFDRWYFGGQQDALNAVEKRGFELFNGRAKCSQCHALGESHALFTDNQFRDDGTGWLRVRGPKATEAQLAALFDEDAKPLPPSDLGRFEVTRDPTHMFQYRTPSLRNVALTAPYMHDGSFATLDAVVRYYSKGGFPWFGIDDIIKPLELSNEEREALVAFLEALTSETVPELIAEAQN